MRKIISLIMVLLLAFGAVGCMFYLKKSVYGSGSASESKNASESESVSGSESPALQQKTLGSLRIGSKIKVSHSEMGDIEFLVVDKSHDDYPENSTTLLTEKIIRLFPFDAAEPNNGDSDRQSKGNNRYSVSNIDQWLNSAAAAGQWYSARHSSDQVPTVSYVRYNYSCSNSAGFVAGFDDAFVAALKDTTIKVALNTVTDGGGYESIVRKFFLPSKAEMFGTAENEVMEGSLLSYFGNSNAKRVAFATEYATAHSNYSFTDEKGLWYMLRTPYSSYSCEVRDVRSDGSMGSMSAYAGDRGVRPLCNLSSDTLVSESPDENGYYSLVFN